VLKKKIELANLRLDPERRVREILIQHVAMPCRKRPETTSAGRKLTPHVTCLKDTRSKLKISAEFEFPIKIVLTKSFQNLQKLPNFSTSDMLRFLRLIDSVSTKSHTICGLLFHNKNLKIS
jgi:hypothetical protein